MKKFYKISGIVAAIGLGIGLLCIMIGVAGGAVGTVYLTKGGFKINDQTERWQHTSDNETPFTSVDIDIDAAKVYILESDDDQYKVEVDIIGSEETITYSNTDGLLTIKNDNKSNSFTINIFGGISNNPTGEVYIYVPKAVKLDKISINCDVGDVEIDVDTQVDRVNVTTDVGEITISNGTYKNVELKADVGDIQTEGATITEKVVAKADVGEVTLDGNLSCDIDVSTDVGSINIKTSLSSDSYRCNVSASAGEVEVFGVKDSGADVEIVGSEKAEYSITAEASLGSIEIESIK